MNKRDLEWLRENDPITYYEMTSNPTGADSDEWGFGCVFTALGLILIIGFLLWKIL